MLILAGSFQSRAQLFLNDNAVMDVGPDALLYVNNGDIENRGEIHYAGEIELIGNIINDDILESITGEPSLFGITGDWTNNGNFVSHVGQVVFNGNSQVVGGTSDNDFYDLEFNGTLTDIKDIQTTTEVGNELNIGGTWIELNTNELTLLNSQILIAENGGLFHADFGGKVTLNSTAASIRPYPIPFGYNTTNLLRRNAELENPVSGKHSVAFYKGTPSVYGMDASQTIDSICRIFNDHFWFLSTESGVNVGIQDESDPVFQRVATWDNAQWINVPANSLDMGLPYSHAVISQNAGDSAHFTFSSEQPFIEAVPYREVYHRTQTGLSVDYYLPSTGLLTWFPDDQLSCSNCPDPVFESLNSELLTIQVENDICFDEANMQIEVLKRPDVFMQNAFSPKNGDNVNNTFSPVLIDNETLIFMRIYNRWGEKLYEGTGSWDGTYLGSDVPPGAYIYEIKVRRVYGPRHHEFIHKSGTVQVLR